MTLSTLIRARGVQTSLLSNSAFLIANTLAGSLFGFLFWVIVARTYTPAQVGLGAAYITAIAFLTNLGEMGLGAAWLRFLPAMDERRQFVNSSLAAAGASTLIVTVLFVAGIPIWSPELGELLHSGAHLELFLLATLAFGLAQLLDRLYVALQVTHFMFLRNLAANMLRIALVVLASGALGSIGLLIAVGGSALVTLALSMFVLAPRALPGYRVRPAFAWSLLRERAGYTLGNHFSLLLWNAPPLIYPLLIVSLLGPEANAQFYTCWMIANLLFVVPTAIGTSAIARAASRDDDGDRAFWRSMRLTLLGLLPVAAGLLLAARIVLQMFGTAYTAAGSGMFVYLVGSIFPYTVNTFVIAHHRIHQHTARVVWVSGAVTALCLGLSIAGAALHGLTGVGAAWLIGQSLGVAIALWSRHR